MIPPGHRVNFATLERAFRQGDVALLECYDKVTRVPVYVIAAVQREQGEMISFVPFAKFFDGNPYDQIDPPDPNEEPPCT